MADNLDQGAREMADLLKNGKTEDFKERLADDAKSMSREDFNSFMDKLKAENAKDLAANKDLPGLNVEKRQFDGIEAVTKVDITTPGAICGNWWRNSETVLSGHGDGMLAVAEGAIKGRQGQLEQVMRMAEGTYDKPKPVEQQRGGS